jgi:Flagellar hook-length control protein FliK
MIDLPSFFQNSIKDLQNQRQTQIESLVQRVNLRIGQTTTALVERVTNVDKPLADRLLQINTSTNGAQKLPAELLTQANLKLIELNIQGQKLLTLTDQPISAKQTVELQLKTASQLALLAPSKNPTTNNSSHSSTQSRSLSNAQPNTQQLNALSQTYREALPRQLPLQQAFRLVQAIKQLPELQQQLPVTIRNSLTQLQQHTHTPQQLSTAKGLQSALQRSGVQLEHSLNQQLQLKTAQTNTTTGTQKLDAAPVKDVTQNLTNIRQPPDTTNIHRQTATTGSRAQPLTAQDAKAALLQTEQRVSQYLAQLPRTAAQGRDQTQPLPPLPSQAPVNTLVTLLKQFLQSSTSSSGNKDVSPREAVLQTLQLQLQAAVAKMQTQQLHTLSQQFAKPDQQQAQHWLIELPVRLNNDLSSVEVRIDEDWVHSQDEEEENNDKVRLWTVMLAFDLPDRGKLFTQLKIVQDTVSANLWAEQTTTLAEARRKLKDLRQRLDADGVNVKSIECLNGLPPQQDIRLDYALVDIKT